MLALRKGSLRIRVNQDNVERKLIIDGLEKSIDQKRDGDYLGYDIAEITGTDFAKILTEEVNEIIEDNIEFSLEGNDLKTVLEKIINLKIVNKFNEHIDVSANIEREISTPDKFLFLVTIERKFFLKDKIKSVLNELAEKQQVLHEITGVVNGPAYIDALDRLMDFLYSNNIDAALCIISVEGFPAIRMNEGKDKVDQLLAKVGHVMRTTFRSKDMIGYIGLGKFAVFMPRTETNEIEYPLKRLESNLKKEGVLNSKISYNARFDKIQLDTSSMDSIEAIKNRKIDYNFSAR